MDLDTRHRIGRARLLRQLGKTYDEIRTVVGPVRDETLADWPRGIPRPPATYRGRSMTEVRLECRRLRSGGLTYDEIRPGPACPRALSVRGCGTFQCPTDAFFAGSSSLRVSRGPAPQRNDAELCSVERLASAAPKT
jgi:hypothetical protein